MKFRLILTSMMIASVSTVTGCYSLHEELSEISYRNSLISQAEAAWHAAHACYRDIPNRYDFHRGFRDGYLNVANGGDGCPPTLAPSHYWSSCFRSDNCGAIQSWYDGFAHGAIAAEQDGAGSQNTLLLSPAFHGQCDKGECEHHFVKPGNQHPVEGEPIIIPNLNHHGPHDVTPLENTPNSNIHGL